MGDPESKCKGILKYKQLRDTHWWGQIVGLKQGRMRCPERQQVTRA